MMFKSKVDLWLVILIFCSLAFALGITILAYIAEGKGNWQAMLIAVVAAGAATALILWIFRTTDYRIEESLLLIRSGPLRIRVEIPSIVSIKPTHSPLSSPALSLDRLAIRYRRGSGERSVLVSPVEKQAFIEALKARNPSIVTGN